MEKSWITLQAEGVLDPAVQVVTFDTWLPEVELALYRVELPNAIETLSTAQTKLERKASKMSRQKSLGTGVKFGQHLQLRHVHSSRLLSLTHLEAAGTPGAFRVRLSPPKESVTADVSLQPVNKLQKAGEPVRYQDRLQILFHFGGIKYSLNCTRQTTGFEINGSHHMTPWLFVKYDEYSPDNENMKTESPFLIQLKRFSLHVTPKITRKQNSIGGNPEVEKADTFLITDEDDYGGYWIAEKSKSMSGGPIFFNESVYLRNLKSGLYLVNHLKLAPQPDPKFTFTFPKPDSFIGSSEIPFNYPVLLHVSENRVLSPEKSEQRAEIMSKIVPAGRKGFTVEEIIVEADLILEEATPGESSDALFELIPVSPAASQFMMQVSKLVPKFQRLRDQVFAWRDALKVDMELPIWNFQEDIEAIMEALKGCVAVLKAGHPPETYEDLQSIVVGLDLHAVLLHIAEAVFDTQEQSKEALEQVPAYRDLTMVLFKAIWAFLIEIVADNYHTCCHLEKAKKVICRMVGMEKALIGSLLTEIYRLVDPEMPDYEQEFKDWCELLQPLQAENLEEQTVFIRLIRCLCEVGEDVKLEYQRAIVTCLFCDDGFPMIKLMNVDGRNFVHFWQRGHSNESFLTANPALVPDQRLLEDEGEVYTSLESLKAEPLYVEYLYTALSLINTLSKGKLTEGKTYAREKLGLEPNVVISIIQSSEVPLKIKEACLLLIDTLVVSCLPYRSSTETKGEDLCYIYDDVRNGGKVEDYDNPIDFGENQQRDIHFCLKLTLTLLLARERPVDLRNCELKELLEYVKAILRLSYSLIDYEHCSGLYVKCLHKALAYFLVGLSDDKSPKLAKEHWAVTPLQQTCQDAEKHMDMKVQLNDLLKLLVELLTLINRYLKHTKVQNIIRICMTQEQDDPVVQDIIDFKADEKALRRMLDQRIGDRPTDSLMKSNTRRIANYFSRRVLLRGPSTKEYLLRVLLNWTAISPSLKEQFISLLKQLFSESMQTWRILHNVVIISSPMFITMKQSLQQLKERIDFSRLLVDAKYELHNMASWQALKDLCEVLETVSKVLVFQTQRTDDQRMKIQNMVRHLGFHKAFMQLWSIVMVAIRLRRNELPVMKRFRVLLTIFLLSFVRGNDKNRKTIRSLFQPHFYFLTVPQFADLIRELTDFEPLNALDATRFFAYILDNYHEANLGALNYIKMAMVSRLGRVKSEKQNIAARLVAERLNQHLEGKPALVRELIEILALASIDNAPIIAQCRQLIPPAELEQMFVNSDEPEVHHALLQYLRYVYLRPHPDMKEFTDVPRVLRMLQCSVNLVKPVLTGELNFYDSAAEGLIEQVFPKDNPILVEEQKAKGASSNISCLVDLLSSGHTWSMQSGLFTEIPAILRSLGTGNDQVESFFLNFRESLVAFSNLLVIEQQKHPDLEYELLINSLQTCLNELKTVTVERPSGLAGMIKTMATLMKGKTMIRDLDFEFDKQFALQRKSVEQQLGGQGEEYYESLATTFNDVAFRHVASVAKLPKEDLNRIIKMLRRVKRLFAGTKHRKMYYSFMEALVPEDDMRRLVMNQVFFGAEILDEAVESLIKNEDYVEVNAALGFLGKLMDEQTKSFQDKFQELIDRGEKSYYLFFQIKRELETAKQSLLEGSAQRESGLISLNVLTAMNAAYKPAQVPVFNEQHEYIVRALTFLQLCCDNCNLDFQQYMRTQQKQEGRADVDLVTEVALFVIDLREKMHFIVENKGAGKMLVKAIAALLDFVTGPCFENQLLLGNNVQVYLAINCLLRATQKDLSSSASKIHNKTIIFLHTLLEGQPDPTIYQTMVRFLDLGMMREGIEEFYRIYIRGKEALFTQELETVEKAEMNKLKTNILQAIFLLKLQKRHPNHPELKKFAATDLSLEHPYTFYLSNIGYVEIEKKEVIYEHYFSIPFKCKFLTTSSREALIMEVNRNSHQKKIEDFMSKVDVYMREMIHQQKLCSYPTLKQFTTRWKLFAKVSFFLVLAINLQLLFTFAGTLEESMEQHPLNMFIITLMGILQLLTYMLSFVFSMLEYFPNMLVVGGSFVGFEIDKYNKFPHNESQYLKDIYRTLKRAKVDQESFESSIKQIFNNMNLYYNYFYFLISVLAIYQPLFNPVLLLDLIKQNQELVNVLKSITVNARQLLLTGCLGMIIVFLFSIYSFVEFQNYYIAESGLYCQDLFNCFSSTINIGIRSGGLGGEGNITTEDYWARMLFDLLFYLIIIIILLNIIFGIIIDTFAQLRDQKNAVLLDINNVCYVCGQDRSEIEHHGRGWTYHFMCEHSPAAYLAFLIYIKEMPIVDCAGIEKYVKERFEKRDSIFMPTSSRLLQLRSAGQREDEE